MIVYKCLNNLGPADICELIEVSNFENLTLKNVFMNTTLGRRSFSYVAPKLWNALPLHLRLTQTLSCFKSRLKTFLFQSYNDFIGNIYKYIR